MQKKNESNKISSLEMQLIKVKSNMLNETIASKEEKLKDIRATLEQLLKPAKKTSKKPETTTEGIKTETTETVVAEVATPGEEPTPSSTE